MINVLFNYDSNFVASFLWKHFRQNRPGRGHLPLRP
jgi:hypothetical protein